METTNILAWMCQLYLAYFFVRSAYRKVKGYERVTAEFLGWGYAFPAQVTFFLIVVWILGATALLIPVWSGLAALVLLAFMLVAFATLLIHSEFRRLVEPARPIVLLIFVIVVRSSDIMKIINYP